MNPNSLAVHIAAALREFALTGGGNSVAYTDENMEPIAGDSVCEETEREVDTAQGGLGGADIHKEYVDAGVQHENLEWSIEPAVMIERKKEEWERDKAAEMRTVLRTVEDYKIRSVCLSVCLS